MRIQGVGLYLNLTQADQIVEPREAARERFHRARGWSSEQWTGYTMNWLIV